MSLVDGIKYQFEKLKGFFSNLAPGFQKFADAVALAGNLGTVLTDAGKNFFNAIIQAGKDFANSIKPGGKSGGAFGQFVSLGKSAGGSIGKDVGGAFQDLGSNVGGAVGLGLSGSPAFIPQTSAQVASSGSGGDGVAVGLLNQILAAVSSPTQATAKVDFNGKVLADIILDLNRRNARLSA
jgi:hypothetical protein